MRRFFHDQSSETHWIFHMFHTGYCSSFERFPIHDRSVHFVRAGARKHRAFAGIEMGIIFEHAHGSFRRVETGAAIFQNFVTGSQSALESGAIFALFFRCHPATLDRSSAAVNHESNFFFFHIWLILRALSRCSCGRPGRFLAER